MYKLLIGIVISTLFSGYGFAQDFSPQKIENQVPSLTSKIEDYALLNKIRDISLSKGWLLPSEAINAFEKLEITREQAVQLVELKKYEDKIIKDFLRESYLSYSDFTSMLSKDPQSEQVQILAGKHAELLHKYSMSELLIRQKVATVLGTL